MRLPRPLPRHRLVWPSLIGALIALDVWADQGDPDQDTLSELVREWFRVDTPYGKAAFTLALACGANVLHGHICKVV